jgi:hypothetical protein
MAVTSSGMLTFWRLQGVELLLEHQSMPSIESVDHIARTLRKDLIVKKIVDPNSPLASGSKDGTRTLSTTSFHRH